MSKPLLLSKLHLSRLLFNDKATRYNNGALLIDNCLLSFALLSPRRISDGAPVQSAFHVDSDQNILTIASGFNAVVCI